MERIYVHAAEALTVGVPFLPCKGGTVTALGFFDGVHLAHRELLEKTVALARERGLTSAVFTFCGTGGGFKSGGRLFTDDERLYELEALGIDVAVICDFAAVREISAQSFVSDVLIRLMDTRVAVSGYNFRFGKGAAGNAQLLCELLSAVGREYVCIGEYTVLGAPVSSSRIKDELLLGNVRGAAMLLGKPYYISGRISHGLGLGTGMGIPTANLTPEGGKLLPKRGVYFTAAKIGGREYPALTNVGTCPTLGERALHAETFILDFSGDVYESEIKISFIEYIREERSFSSADELVMQIRKDERQARRLAGELKWQEAGQN